MLFCQVFDIPKVEPHIVGFRPRIVSFSLICINPFQAIMMSSETEMLQLGAELVNTMSHATVCTLSER